MDVRFGFVAMSSLLPHLSPSRRMTLKSFQKINDRQAALKKIVRLARENISNTQRLLHHCVAHEVYFYRFSSRLIPLFGHEVTKKINFTQGLEKELQHVGDFVKKHRMRVGFHPDHFTVLNSPRKRVLEAACADLERHGALLKAMKLGHEFKCNIHVGGVYGDKKASGIVFIHNFFNLSEDIQRRICLENDDKTFTAKETLDIAQACRIPMVLDLHHHRCNHQGEKLEDLWPHICKTWSNEGFPPKIHVSSAKSAAEFRSHADNVRVEDIYPFLQMAANYSERLDVMIEAKLKDRALFTLIADLLTMPGVQLINQAAIKIPTK